MKVTDIMNEIVGFEKELKDLSKDSNNREIQEKTNILHKCIRAHCETTLAQELTEQQEEWFTKRLNKLKLEIWGRR